MYRLVPSFSAFVLGCSLLACSHAPSATTPVASSTKIADTKAALRDLWLGHILGVRNVAVATMDRNNAAREAAEQSVVANAEQIAGSIEPFYGKAASDRLFTLLAGHYAGIRQALDATAAGNSTQQEAAIKAVTVNAGEISAFLSEANPYLPKDTVMGLLTAHAAHHFQEFQQLKAGEYVQEADTWRGMKQHIYVVADALTGALAQQFPDKF